MCTNYKRDECLAHWGTIIYTNLQTDTDLWWFTSNASQRQLVGQGHGDLQLVHLARIPRSRCDQFTSVEATARWPGGPAEMVKFAPQKTMGI
jgi:hypothetical protein